eukprot:767091-Hanusia_phi.AAC.6
MRTCMRGERRENGSREGMEEGVAGARMEEKEEGRSEGEGDGSFDKANNFDDVAGEFVLSLKALPMCYADVLRKYGIVDRRPMAEIMERY